MTEYIERESAMQIAFVSPFFSNALMEEIKAIPAADVAPVVHGRWVAHNCDDADLYYCDCSVCGNEGYGTPYCPNCGAKMDEEAHNGT